MSGRGKANSLPQPPQRRLFPPVVDVGANRFTRRSEKKTHRVGMDPRVALREKLEKHPELACSEIPARLRVEPPSTNGFAVELHGGGVEWTVYLGNAGFHETFTSSKEALNFIAWCYSGEARVREVWRGSSPQKAVLEAYENGLCRSVSVTGFIFVPFWRKRREVVLQNPNLLKRSS